MRHCLYRNVKKAENHCVVHRIANMLDVLSENPIDKKTLMKESGLSLRKDSKYIALLIELKLARKTEIITISDLSRVRGSYLEITQLGKNFLNRYINYQEHKVACNSAKSCDKYDRP